MSGGYWDYGRTIQDAREYLDKVSDVMRWLEVAEHQLDWGVSGDSCLACARLRVAMSLEQLFDDRLNACNAVKVAKGELDEEYTMCPSCKERK